ncbi:topoisomerase 1-associated factor 1 [Parathielavia hyrcaniae]|uniref:Topoisomerase 1-associated factor 1 n=1 Tax=Parathielavia hyrcaniae TaxID=113614 RepID=A0AAN6QC24_9PEZI|nr:topoisomerase 1-associated factor 1 [Parathielavia hyrcaniae]
MDDTDVTSDIVHPQVRAHINSLVSALGGYSIDDDGGYKLGDDALEVLRDLKRWIRFHDEKTNRMDVARCLAEANIVGSDLLHILAMWSPNDSGSKYRAKVALACLEVMVPLTWPIEKDHEAMTLNHHRNIPVLQLAQLGYKRAILNFDTAPILSTAIRSALPSMALSSGDRSARDQGIIKLVLYFLRNIAVIAPSPGIKYSGDETQVSRSTLVDAFSFQDVFVFLDTIASNMGDDFRAEDVIVMEIVFHLVKRVDSSKLFVSENHLHQIKADELTAAMQKEAAMLRSYGKHAPTRHSRFGTTTWVKRASGKLSTVSGQDGLLDAAARERKMDSNKSFRPPRRARKEDMEPKNLGPPVTLDERARQQLGLFVSEFLDSCFNPLFGHVRKSLEREAPHVLQYHHSQFFYLVAWFLEAERMRSNARNADSNRLSDGDEVRSFNLIAEVLTQEMFITMNRALDRAYSDKDWPLLTGVMRCFTQVLLTVQEMADSGNEEDQEIADNILSRLFYEETTHDTIANIVRTYKDQGFEYLDACTELTHTFLRILEAYAKQNVDLHVRSRKRIRRKKRAAKAAADVGRDGDQPDAEDDSADDERQAEKTSQERKFDFKRFATRFIPQGVVDTFVAFTAYYRDLDDSQLKRAHRYFHRVAFKQEMSVMLFRLDIIHLFYNMIKGPEPLDHKSPVYKDWEDLVRHIIRKCMRKLEERPALFTELLFSKINSTAHYLEYGHEKQTVSSNPRPAAELDFRRELERDQQIAIVVGVLLDRNQTDHLEWVKKQLSEAESERRAWENAEKALAAERPAGEPAVDVPADPAEPSTAKSAPHATMRPDNNARHTAMFKNPHLRLLMKLAGMERLAPTLDESPDSIWIIPGAVTADFLKEILSLINKAEFTPPTFEDGELAEDQLRRKSAPRKRAAYDDDDNQTNNVHDLINDGSDNDDGTSILFPLGGPTARKRTAADGEPPPKKQRKQRRRRREGSAEEEEEPTTEAQLEAKKLARRKRELEKRRKVKSDMYVDLREDDSDWEGNRERDALFFAGERERQAAKDASFGLSSKPASGERSAWEELLGDGDDDEEDGGGAVARKAKQVRGKRKMKSDDAALAESGDDDEESGTAASDGGSSSSARRATKRRRAAPKPKVVEVSSDDEEEVDEEEGDAMEFTQSSRDGAVTNDTPLSSNPSPAALTSAKKPAETGEGDDEDDDVPVAKAAARARPRARAGFIVESSDEE